MKTVGFKTNWSRALTGRGKLLSMGLVCGVLLQVPFSMDVHAQSTWTWYNGNDTGFAPGIWDENTPFRDPSNAIQRWGGSDNVNMQRSVSFMADRITQNTFPEISLGKNIDFKKLDFTSPNFNPSLIDSNSVPSGKNKFNILTFKPSSSNQNSFEFYFRGGDYKEISINKNANNYDYGVKFEAAFSNSPVDPNDITGLKKTGAAALVLGGATDNDYKGDTLVERGILVVTDKAKITSSKKVVVSTGAELWVDSYYAFTGLSGTELELKTGSKMIIAKTQVFSGLSGAGDVHFTNKLEKYSTERVNTSDVNLTLSIIKDQTYSGSWKQLGGASSEVIISGSPQISFNIGGKSHNLDLLQCNWLSCGINNAENLEGINKVQLKYGARIHTGSGNIQLGNQFEIKNVKESSAGFDVDEGGVLTIDKNVIRSAENDTPENELPGLIKNGKGTLVLSGGVTDAVSKKGSNEIPDINLNGGLVRVGDKDKIGVNNLIKFDGGDLEISQNGSVIENNFYTTATGGGLVVGENKSQTFTGSIGGVTGGRFIKKGDGKLVFNGEALEGGITRLVNGDFEISKVENVKDTKFEFAGGNLVLAADQMTLNNEISVLEDSYLNVAKGWVASLKGKISGSKNLEKTGDGRLEIYYNNPETGDLNISSGSVALKEDGGWAGHVVVQSNALLLNEADGELGSLNVLGKLDTNSSQLKVLNNLTVGDGGEILFRFYADGKSGRIYSKDGKLDFGSNSKVSVNLKEEGFVRSGIPYLLADFKSVAGLQNVSLDDGSPVKVGKLSTNGGDLYLTYTVDKVKVEEEIGDDLVSMKDIDVNILNINKGISNVDVTRFVSTAANGLSLDIFAALAEQTEEQRIKTLRSILPSVSGYQHIMPEQFATALRGSLRLETFNRLESYDRLYGQDYGGSYERFRKAASTRRVTRTLRVMEEKDGVLVPGKIIDQSTTVEPMESETTVTSTQQYEVIKRNVDSKERPRTDVTDEGLLINSPTSQLAATRRQSGSTIVGRAGLGENIVNVDEPYLVNDPTRIWVRGIGGQWSADAHMDGINRYDESVVDYYGGMIALDYLTAPNQLIGATVLAGSSSGGDTGEGVNFVSEASHFGGGLYGSIRSGRATFTAIGTVQSVGYATKHDLSKFDNIVKSNWSGIFGDFNLSGRFDVFSNENVSMGGFFTGGMNYFSQPEYFEGSTDVNIIHQPHNYLKGYGEGGLNVEGYYFTDNMVLQPSASVALFFGQQVSGNSVYTLGKDGSDVELVETTLGNFGGTGQIGLSGLTAMGVGFNITGGAKISEVHSDYNGSASISYQF